MTGAVHVLDLAESLPHDQAFYDEENRSRAKRPAVGRVGTPGAGRAIARRTSDTEVAAGISEVVATTGGGVHTSSVMRFLRERIVVHVATRSMDQPCARNESHSHVRNGAADPFAPPSSNVTTDTDGALHAVIASSTDDVHSGLFGPAPESERDRTSPLGVTRFRVTFTAPGAFRYICALHDNEGMVGTVLVPVRSLFLGACLLFVFLAGVRDAALKACRGRCPTRHARSESVSPYLGGLVNPPLPKRGSR